ncbi:MAG: hypothetical protein ACREOK_07375 [Gemmatimonadaceae bacterium]
MMRGSLFLIAATVSGLQAQTQLLIVSGLGGDPKYTQEFGQLSGALAKAASERAGLPDSAITWLGEKGSPTSPWYRGLSSRANLEQVFQRLASGGDAPVVVILIGHGSGEGAETRVSLPGPDMTAADFAGALAKFGMRPIAFLNLASASGDMLELLAAPSRVVMTATKSAFERNESRFARYFVDALALDGADTDKDGRVSLLEAFRFAEAETERFYENETRLATEHAQMADEGMLAGRFFLSSGAAGAGPASGRLAELYRERNALDEQIQALKAKKGTMATAAYDSELEKLLVALAQKSREIRDLEKGGGS